VTRDDASFLVNGVFSAPACIKEPVLNFFL